MLSTIAILGLSITANSMACSSVSKRDARNIIKMIKDSHSLINYDRSSVDHYSYVKNCDSLKLNRNSEKRGEYKVLCDGKFLNFNKNYSRNVGNSALTRLGTLSGTCQDKKYPSIITFKKIIESQNGYNQLLNGKVRCSATATAEITAEYFLHKKEKFLSQRPYYTGDDRTTPSGYYTIEDSRYVKVMGYVDRKDRVWKSVTQNISLSRGQAITIDFTNELQEAAIFSSTDDEIVSTPIKNLLQEALEVSTLSQNIKVISRDIDQDGAKYHLFAKNDLLSRFVGNRPSHVFGVQSSHIKVEPNQSDHVKNIGHATPDYSMWSTGVKLDSVNPNIPKDHPASGSVIVTSSSDYIKYSVDYSCKAITYNEVREIENQRLHDGAFADSTGSVSRE